ncbi:MAG: 6-phosphogluconolactonase [Clostridia bacterium]|nr:6-phosphogluconolactonase [Clostridia bacterium]
MDIFVFPDPQRLGEAAASEAARILRDAVGRRGKARIVLSTGASQFAVLDALTRQSVPWAQVEMFHLDEYAGLPDTHRASFRRYLRERFIGVAHPGKAHLVDGTQENMAALATAIRSEPVDLGLIGIGENAHIAFNDPPADFATREAYILVRLDERCKAQQVREKWFDSLADVPEQAVTMTVHQILQCERIISCVPFAVKAGAVRDTLQSPVTPNIPATILKTHPHLWLYLDADAFARVEPEKILPEGAEHSLTFLC